LFIIQRWEGQLLGYSSLLHLLHKVNAVAQDKEAIWNWVYVLGYSSTNGHPEVRFLGLSPWVSHQFWVYVILGWKFLLVWEGWVFVLFWDGVWDYV
jgi:hypothetical protein